MADRPKTEPGQPRRPRTDPGLPSPREEGPGPLARRMQAAAKRAVDRVVGNHWITGCLFLVVFTGLLSIQECGISYPEYQVGEIAPSDVAAPFQVTVVASAATKTRRQEERDGVLPVYNYESMLHERGRNLLQSFFELGRGYLAEQEAASAEGAAESSPAALEQDLRGLLPLPVDDPALQLLRGDGFSPETELRLLDAYDALRGAPRCC